MSIRKIYYGRKRFRDFNNMMHISLRHKYVYSAISKVANSSIKSCLFHVEYKDVWKDGLVDKKSLRDKRLAPTLSPFQLSDELLEKVFHGTDYYRFAFVRNPYARLLSCYLDRVLDKRSVASREVQSKIGKTDISFREFCVMACGQESRNQNDHWRRQCDDILLDRIDYDFIGKFERLEEDMRQVSVDIFGDVLPEMELKKDRNHSPSRTNAQSKLMEYYTDDLKELVYDSYRDDFLKFSYSPDFG